MKKLIAMILALAAVFSLTACDSNTENPEETQVQDATGGANAVVIPEEEPTDPLTSAKAAIEKGDHQTAYDILSAIENPTEEEKELLSCFEYKIKEEKRGDGTVRTYFYDETGKLLKDEHVKTDGSINISYYDETGKVNTRETIRGDQKSEYINVYDENGRYVESRRKTSRGWVTTNTFTYDDHGNWLTQDSYKLLSSLLDSGESIRTELSIHFEYGYTYDDNGNMLTYEEIRQDILIGTTKKTVEKHSYDNGKLVKTESYSEDALASVTVITYNQQGLRQTEETTTVSGEKSVTTYSYQLFYNPDLAK